MADEEILVDGRALSDLRVVDLKKELDKRGLSKSGSKSQLSERLKTYILDEREGGSNIADTDAGLLNENIVPEENEYVKQYFEQKRQLLESQREARKKIEEEEERQRLLEQSQADQEQEAVGEDVCARDSQADSEPKGKEVGAGDQVPSKPADQEDQPKDTSSAPEENMRQTRRSRRSGDSSTINNTTAAAAADKGGNGDATAEMISPVEEKRSSRRRWSRKDSKQKEESVEETASVEKGEEANPGVAIVDTNSQEAGKQRTGKDGVSHEEKTKESTAVPTDDSNTKPTEENMETNTAEEEKQADAEERDQKEGKVSEKTVETQDRKQEERQKQPVHDRPARSRKKRRSSVSREASESSGSSSSSSRSSSSGSSSSDSRSRSSKRSKGKVRKCRSSHSVEGKNLDKKSTEKHRSVSPMETSEAQKSSKEEQKGRSGSRSPDDSARKLDPKPAANENPPELEEVKMETSPPKPATREVKSISSSTKKKPVRRSRSTSSSSSSSGSSRSRSRSTSTSRSRSPPQIQEESTVENGEMEVKQMRESKRDARDIQVGEDSVNKKPEDGEVEEKQDNHERPEEKDRRVEREAKSEDSESEKKDAEGSMEIDENSDNMKNSEKTKTLTEETEAAIKPTRRISRPNDKDGGRGSTETKEGAEKPARKRRWGSSTAKSTNKTTTVNISTDSLKSLIPEIKTVLTSDPILDLGVMDGSLSDTEEDKRDIKIKRTVVQRLAEESEEELEGEEKAVEVVQKEEVVVREVTKEVNNDPVIVRQTSRTLPSLSLETEEPEKARRSPSPPRNPVTKIVHVYNLVRPFTLLQLTELLKRTGTLVEGGFWIDKIKSHCYAMFETEDQAFETRKALHGTRWPSSNPKILRVEFAQEDEFWRHKATDDGSVPVKKDPKREAQARKRRESEKSPRDSKKREEQRKQHVREWDRDKLTQRSRSRSPQGSRSKSRERRRQERLKERKERKEKKVEEEAPAKLLDDLFKKTKATPCIYWLPLTEEQIVKRDEERKNRQVEREKRKRELDAREAAEKKLLQHKSAEAAGRTQRPRSRSPQRSRDQRAQRERDRSPDRDQRRRPGEPARSGRDRRSPPPRARSRSRSRSRGARRR